MASTASAHLACLCSSITLPGTFLAHPTFPIPCTICHCNSCRYTFGSLLPAFVGLSSPPPDDIKARLTVYQPSELVIQYFCSTCGCHCFAEHPQKENEWFCAAGIVHPPSCVKDVIELVGHEYVFETVDGGLVPALVPITASGAGNMFAGKRGTAPCSPRDVDVLVQTARKKAASGPGPNDVLEARCHCGGVDLRIERANYDSEPKTLKDMMDPAESHKYRAVLCACRSCRLSLGFSIDNWMYTSIVAVRNARTSSPVVFGVEAEKEDANEGLSLKHYRSSEGVWRSFCAGCGASVFYYTAKEGRREMVSVNVGILRAGSGSLAREWLYFDGAVCTEECVHQTLTECMKRRGSVV